MRGKNEREPHPLPFTLHRSTLNPLQQHFSSFSSLQRFLTADLLPGLSCQAAKARSPAPLRCFSLDTISTGGLTVL